MSGCPRYDFHIHTKHLGCANSTMEVSDIVKECKRLGVKSIGITDHLNALEFLPKHIDILSDIQNLETEGIEVYFGVELNFTSCDGEFAFSKEIKEKYGFQFAVGGIHSPYLQEYDLRKIIDIQHRHHLKTCQDKLVDVLVHPYWFGVRDFPEKKWPWFNSMKAVPEKYIRELAQAARETGTALEINATANLLNPRFPESYRSEYFEYLSILAEEGPVFSVSSDAHDIAHLGAVKSAWKVVEDLKIPPERIWKPAQNPLKR